MAENKRIKHVTIKVFPEEFEVIRKLANMNSQTMSEFIRQAIRKEQRELEKAGAWA